MRKRPNKLPEYVVDHWPEVLKDIDVSVVPLEYLHSIRVSFTDGKIWEIDLNKNRKTTDPEEIEESLDALLAEYEDVIENVDFRLDVERVKHDVSKRTRHFLKKGK